jgi:DNA-binding transcriptional MerR regulator
VSDGELLAIGSFSMLGGLSIPALRHYDEVGVLKPARVDPHTGYRYYRPDQVREARVIRALRALDLSIDEIHDVLEGDEGHVRTVLVDHRKRLSERAHVLAQQMRALDEFIEKGVFVPVLEGNRIVMVNIAVNELEQSRQFYENMLDVEFAEERHGDGPVHLNATFGEWNTPSWFLVSLWPDSDRAGTAAIGFLVEDLDGAYKRALAAGAGDVFGPRNIEGMPRTAQITDPSGNQIGLYQG